MRVRIVVKWGRSGSRSARQKWLSLLVIERLQKRLRYGTCGKEPCEAGEAAKAYRTLEGKVPGESRVADGGLTARHQGALTQLFPHEVIAPPPSRLPGLLSSLALHCAGALMLPQIMGKASTPQVERAREVTYKVKYLNLKDRFLCDWDGTLAGRRGSEEQNLADKPRLFEAVTEPETAKSGRQSSAQDAAGERVVSRDLSHGDEQRLREPELEARASGRRKKERAGEEPRVLHPGTVPAPRHFEIPSLSARSVEHHILLQAPDPPDLLAAEKVQAPPMLFWAANPEATPVSLPAVVYARPGVPRLESSAVLSNTPVLLEVSRTGQMTGGLTEEGTRGVEKPALAAEVGSPRPVRVFQVPFPVQASQATLARNLGEPTHVVSIPAPGFQIVEQIAVPPGNLSPNFGSPEGGGVAVAPAAEGEKNDNTSKQQATVINDREAPAETGRHEGVLVTAAAAPEGAGVMPTARVGMPAGSVLPLPGIPKVFPKEGSYDLVVMQTEDQEMFPATAGILSGRPIYTVYLDVGMPAEWMLKFCLPGTSEETPQVRAGVLKLPSAEPLRAPYPQLTLAPPLSVLPPEAYILVRGFINRDGVPTGLSLVRKTDPETEERLLSYLNQWQFRPAMRGGKSVEVEILLVIPRA